jgi:endonuclease III
LIYHGRQVCDARKPLCEICELADLCPSFGKVNRQKELDRKSTPAKTAARKAKARRPSQPKP